MKHEEPVGPVRQAVETMAGTIMALLTFALWAIAIVALLSGVLHVFTGYDVLGWAF